MNEGSFVRRFSGHSQAMNSAIGEHLLTINSCRTSYEDICFSVLHRATDKSHLVFLEAIYISMNRPSLCRQLNNRIFWGTARHCGDLGFFFIFLHLVSGNPNYIFYTPVFI